MPKARHASLALAVLLLAGCASGGQAPDPVADALKLRQLGAECDAIGIASLAAKQAQAITPSQGLQLSRAGVAACTAVDVATATLDTYRASDRNPTLAHALSVAVTAADATMIALRTLAKVAGVQWSTP